LHLPEVHLTRQSGEVPEKNQQKVVVKVGAEINRLGFEVQEPQAVEIDSFHVS
jgi:hypothetical protein